MVTKVKKNSFFRNYFPFFKNGHEKYVQFRKPIYFLKLEFLTEKICKIMIENHVIKYGLTFVAIKNHSKTPGGRPLPPCFHPVFAIFS
jgi:hypothetical protein